MTGRDHRDGDLLGSVVVDGVTYEITWGGMWRRLTMWLMGVEIGYFDAASLTVAVPTPRWKPAFLQAMSGTRPWVPWRVRGSAVELYRRHRDTPHVWNPSTRRCSCWALTCPALADANRDRAEAIDHAATELSSRGP